MKKRMIIMLIGLSILFGAIVGFKILGYYGFKKYLASREEIATVSAMKAEYSKWQSVKKYYGSVISFQAVTISTELSGVVQEKFYLSGDVVKKGDKLLQLNAEAEIAQLHSLEANTKLAKITLDRDTAQYAIKAISKATVDADLANYKSLLAQTQQQAAIVEKKTIRAPFDGKLGVNLVSVGQYVNPGDGVVPIETKGIIYVEFYVPQPEIPLLQIGQAVRVLVDAYPKRIYAAKIFALNTVIDAKTRNIKVRAKFDEVHDELASGMFATIDVDIGQARWQIRRLRCRVY